MTGPVPSLPAVLDTHPFDPDPADHWLLQRGHLYRSRLAEDQSDAPEASLFTYEGRADGLAYFSQRTARAVYHFALPPDQLERAFYFHRPGEHDAPVPVSHSATMPPGGPVEAGDGPQAQPAAWNQPPPLHEPIDTSGVTLSRNR